MRLRRVGLQRQVNPQIFFRSEFHHITGTAIFVFTRLLMKTNNLIAFSM